MDEKHAALYTEFWLGVVHKQISTLITYEILHKCNTNPGLAWRINWMHVTKFNYLFKLFIHISIQMYWVIKQVLCVSIQHWVATAMLIREEKKKKRGDRAIK